jgi:Zn-dependent protease with chaperone function
MRAGAARTIPGRAFPPLSAREVPARLSLDEGRADLLAETGEVLAQARARDLEIDMAVGRAPRRITFPDGTLFETEDAGAVRAVLPRSGWDLLQRYETFGPHLVFFIVAAVVGAVAVWRFALPALVSLAIALTPAPLVKAMDRGALQTLDLSMAEPSRLDAVEQGRAEAMFETLLAHVPPEELGEITFNLEFRDLPGMGPNALALPGGTVVLTDALVREFPDDDVIAGVLAHEIGHIVEEHGLTQLYRSLGVFVLVSLIAGDTGPILEDVLLEGGVLLSLSYSRAHEREADAYALRLADRAGYDPAGLLAFFESLPDAETEASSWASTHPASGERAQAIRDYLGSR